MTKNLSRVNYSRRFQVQLQKAPLKIQKAFRARRQLFYQNPHSLLLKNHLLRGNYAGYRSINITGNWRAIFSEVDQDGMKIIVFEALGTHSQLYK